MRQEYGDDEGKTAAARLPRILVTQFRKARQILDDFKPDFVVLWGDDQYENFKEDIIPPFVYLPTTLLRPSRGRVEALARTGTGPKTRLSRCVGIAPPPKPWPGLLTEGFDVSYAYKPLHDELGHAFLQLRDVPRL